jgi:glutathione S-transferase
MEFVDVETAKNAEGVRLVIAAGVPSPWSEAAKSILHVKKIPFVGVRGTVRDEAIRTWLPGQNFPVLLVDKEKPRTGWAEILAFAERVRPEPRLVPEGDARITVLGLAHEIMDEDGLNWSMRVRSVAASLTSGGKQGFPLPIAQYLAARYGCSDAWAESAKSRATGVLQTLDAQLAKSGGPWFLGAALSARALPALARRVPDGPGGAAGLRVDA